MLRQKLATATAEVGLEEYVRSSSIEVVLWATVILIAIIGIVALTKRRSSIFFGSIVVIVIATSSYLIGSTIYLNNVSSSGGPVHWHADFEIWSCGKQMELKDPVGKLSNKIGTATLHEHNDKRIHLEGVVVDPYDASLERFFDVVGGKITDKSLVFPTNEGLATLTNGSFCGMHLAELQVFAYRTDEDGYYTVTKLEDPANYIISPEPNTPPADCIIFEFDVPKPTTDKLCRSYLVAEQIGRLKGKK